MVLIDTGSWSQARAPLLRAKINMESLTATSLLGGSVKSILPAFASFDTSPHFLPGSVGIDRRRCQAGRPEALSIRLGSLIESVYYPPQARDNRAPSFARHL